MKFRPTPRPTPRPYAPASPLPARLARVAAVVAGLIAVMLSGAAPASAHAALIRTDPAQGSVVRTAPQRVVLTFSEGVLLSQDSLRVLDPRGTDVAVGTPAHADVAHSGSTAAIGLRPGLGDGTYTVAWRAVSQDSHPVSGAFTFSVGAASRTVVDLSGVTPVGGGAAGTLYGVARWFAYLGFALLVGSSVFLGVCWPRGALRPALQRLASGGWATLVAATIALIMLRGPYVDGKGLGEAFDLGVMRASLETRPGAALLSRLLLLAAAAVFLAVLFGGYARREDPEERADLAWGLGIGGAVVAVGIAATWAMAEHASVGLQRRLAMPVDVVHLLSMATWLGGLITLLTALWAPSMAGTRVPASAVRRFSTIALTAITLLVSTGTYQAWRQVGTWRAFTDTSYGRLLLIKIGLVCTLVGIAWFSRRWTGALGETPKAAAGTMGTAGTAEGATDKATDGATGSTAAGTAGAVRVGAAAGTPDAATATAARTAEGGAGGASSASGETVSGSGDGAADDGHDAHAPSHPADPAVPEPVPDVRAAQLRRQQAARRAATARKALAADPARGALRRSVLAEAAVAVVLLAVTTMLSGSQPGRAAEEQKALGNPSRTSSASSAASAPSAPSSATAGLTVPYDTGGPNGKGTATVSLAPARAGARGELRLALTVPDGRPADVPEVRVAFTLSARGLGPIPVRLDRTGPGRYTAAGVSLPLPGAWQIAVTVRTSDIDEVTVTRTLRVAS